MTRPGPSLRRAPTERPRRLARDLYRGRSNRRHPARVRVPRSGGVGSPVAVGARALSAGPLPRGHRRTPARGSPRSRRGRRSAPRRRARCPAGDAGCRRSGRRRQRHRTRHATRDFAWLEREGATTVGCPPDRATSPDVEGGLVQGPRAVSSRPRTAHRAPPRRSLPDAPRGSPRRTDRTRRTCHRRTWRARGRRRRGLQRRSRRRADLVEPVDRLRGPIADPLAERAAVIGSRGTWPSASSSSPASSAFRSPRSAASRAPRLERHVPGPSTPVTDPADRLVI